MQYSSFNRSYPSINFGFRSSKCIYVLATYEVDDKKPMPTDKAALMALVRAKAARPFHKVVFEPNSKATDFPK